MPLDPGSADTEPSRLASQSGRWADPPRHYCTLTVFARYGGHGPLHRARRRRPCDSWSGAGRLPSSRASGKRGSAAVLAIFPQVLQLRCGTPWIHCVIPRNRRPIQSGNSASFPGLGDEGATHASECRRDAVEGHLPAKDTCGCEGKPAGQEQGARHHGRLFCTNCFRHGLHRMHDLPGSPLADGRVVKIEQDERGQSEQICKRVPCHAPAQTAGALVDAGCCWECQRARHARVRQE